MFTDTISNRNSTRLLTLLLSVVFLLSLSAWAQDNDPPSRVARMSYAQGTVSFQPGGEGDWVSAVPNRPLTSGDKRVGHPRLGGNLLGSTGSN